MTVNYKQSYDDFTIGDSVIEAVMVVAVHLLALFAGCQTSLDVDVRAMLAALVVLSLFIQLSDYNDKRYIRLRFSERSGWELASEDGSFGPINFDKSSVITRWMSVLYCLCEQRGATTIVVFNDALPEKEYRKLLALIKTSGVSIGR